MNEIEIIKTLETFKKKIDEMIVCIKKNKVKSPKAIEEETYVKDLLKEEFIITNDSNDLVLCGDICRYLTIKSDKYSPRKFDNIVSRILKTMSKKVEGETLKYKIGIKKIQCEIE